MNSTTLLLEQPTDPIKTHSQNQCQADKTNTHVELNSHYFIYVPCLNTTKFE